MENKNIRSRKALLTCLIVMIGFLPLILSLTSCSPLSSSDVVNNLFPNVWVFLTHIIAAVILIVLMVWLVWKPAKKSLDKRHDYIAKEISDAQKAKEVATIEQNEANQLKITALSQSMSIATQAKAEAFKIVEDAKADAKQSAAKILKDAQADVENEKQKAKENIQDNIINIAFDAAESVLGREIKKEDENKYIDDLLSSIEQDINKIK